MSGRPNAAKLRHSDTATNNLLAAAGAAAPAAAAPVTSQRGRANSDSGLHLPTLAEIRVEADRLGHLAKDRALVVGERIRQLLSFDDLDDEWLRHNPAIRSGYRNNFTFGEAVRSLFQLHNETVNVWTHILSAVWFLWLAYVEATTTDSWVIIIYLLGAVFLFLCSASFHNFTAMGVATSKALVKLDYMGILVQIALSFVTALHFSFFCNDDSRLVYQTIIVVLCAVGAWVCLSPTFSRPDYATVRVIVFGAIISFAVFPLVHMVALHGIHGRETSELAIGFVWMVGFYLLGSIIYASRWPESSWPGHFDTLGASHQLWHVCVTVAAYLHYTTLWHYREYRIEFGCPA